MEKTFRTLFNLLPGEGHKAWLFSVLGFLWSYGVYGCLTLSEGLFLENVGASNLPKVYFFLAAAMCLSSGGLILALRRLSLNRLLLLVLFITLLSYGGAALFFMQCGAAHPLWVWYLFRMMGTVLPLSIYVCYWAFIDQYYDLQDAKRVFCLYNAVLFFGDACAGATLSWGLDIVGMNALLVLFVALIALSVPFVGLIAKLFTPVLEEHSEGVNSCSDITFRSFLKTVLRSKFTLTLMLFYFVMQLLVICTEYNCFEVFEATFADKGEHGVTQFLGACTAWISVANTVFGLFIYSRFTKKLGVNNITLIAPLFFLVVFVFWSFNTVLAVAVLGLIAREGMTYTFDDNNLNLLVSGVPTKVKNQVRISIESFFEPLGTLISALLLLGLQSQSKAIGLGLAVFVLGLAFILRSAYPKALFQNLLATTIRLEKKRAFPLTHFSKGELRKIITILLRKLKRGGEKEQLLALESLVKIESTTLLPRLLNRIDRFGLKGKLAAVDILSRSSFGTDTRVMLRLQRWKTNLPHPSLHKEIQLHIARQGRVSLTSKQIQQQLNSSCLRTARACALSLNHLASDMLVSLSEILIENLKRHSDPDIRTSLFSALEKCASYLQTEPLIDMALALRKQEKNRLVPILAKGGARHLPHLLAVVKDSSALVSKRLFSAKVVAEISLPTLKKEIDALIKKEIDQTYFYLFHAQTIQRQLPAIDLKLLTGALFFHGRSLLDFMIVLLGTANSLEMSEVLVHSLTSPNQKLRAQTLEMIEKISDAKFYKELMALLQDPHSSKLTHTYLRKGYTPLKLMQLLEAMGKTHSPALQAVASTIKDKLNLYPLVFT